MVSLEDFEFRQKLGEGNYSKVYLCKKTSPGPNEGKYFAAKISNKKEVLKFVRNILLSQYYSIKNTFDFVLGRRFTASCFRKKDIASN